jgi:hypothetical protein
MCAAAHLLGASLPDLAFEPIIKSLTMLEFILVAQLAICYITYCDAVSQIAYFTAEGVRDSLTPSRSTGQLSKN